MIPSDSPLFQASSTALGIRGWTGCVIGQNRESYAVIMFDSIAAYEHYVHLAKIAAREGTRPVADFPRQRAINYEAKAAMRRAWSRRSPGTTGPWPRAMAIPP